MVDLDLPQKLTAR